MSKYPEIPNFHKLTEHLSEYARVAVERGDDRAAGLLAKAEESLKASIEAMKNLQGNDAHQPDGLEEIHALRPEGPRRLWAKMDTETYRDRLEGAFLGRMAGCTLGAPVEFWSIEAMEKWANYTGDAFPPTDYWSKTAYPYNTRYVSGLYEHYTRSGMNGVPVDDDVTYTLLGLLIAEEYGIDFTTEDAGKAWVKYLPIACTAEEIALEGLKNGVSAMETGGLMNPYRHWIGADIRCDPFGYMAPGYPEKAAEMAYRDAYLSHRQNGVYGSMFFAAAIAAGFTVSDPLKALEIGLTEIPKESDLTKDIKWALEAGKGIHNYRDARNAVEERFKGMSNVHTNNNACLTVFGLMIGAGDFTKTIGETVAMGMDNDCTAATAGSVLGACLGKAGIPERFTKNFNNTVRSYFFGNPDFKIDDLLSRFEKQAEKALK